MHWPSYIICKDIGQYVLLQLKSQRAAVQYNTTKVCAIFKIKILTFSMGATDPFSFAILHADPFNKCKTYIRQNNKKKKKTSRCKSHTVMLNLKMSSMNHIV